MFKDRILYLALSLTLTTATSAYADGATISPPEIVAVLKNAKVLKNEDNLRASYNDHEAVVTTARAAGASDKDCKIDAVLIAKTIMQSFPTDVLRVKVLFSDYDKQQFSEVKISKGDVRSFGSGQMTVDELLASIELSNFKDDVSVFSKTPTDSSKISVQPGFMEDKRLLLASRITGLKEKGTNVKAFVDYFQQIEDLVKAGNESKAKEMIESLNDKLTEQDKMREQANQASIRYEVIRFQNEIQGFTLTGKKCPITPAQIYQVQQLVLAGRNAEARQLMDALTKKLRQARGL